jgi:hypothetical protein
MHRNRSQAWMVVVTLSFLLPGTVSAASDFRAGAAAVDVTPREFPVTVVGHMLARTATEVHTPLHAKAIVLDDGDTRLAIVVVDSCALPRSLLDEAKAVASQSTGIPVARMLISATHTHSAPATIGALGTDADPNYPPVLKAGLVEAIKQANENLAPARVGFAVGDAAPYTAVRRWVRRPDRVVEDPFGNLTVRANMHPGHQSDDAIGPTGPTDPDLSVISFQSADGRPIALLANFSMHYYGAPAISADYFGLFADRVRERIADDESTPERPPFVAMMSHGPSGDIWLRDYLQPEPDQPLHDISSYTEALVDIAVAAYHTIDYRQDVTLAMAQLEIPLAFRLPDQQRLEWARRMVDAMEGELPRNLTEVYAREALLLDEQQGTQVILQAIRIGDLGITAMPTETYALTGLKLKACSPLQPTINIELANDSAGYIPPPEQHELGGYNTWPARSAALEVNAEPKIVEAVLQLLEQVAGSYRRRPAFTDGTAARAILDSRPVAYWRMNEFSGPEAHDRLGRHTAFYEPGVLFHLEGPHSDRFNTPGETNRAAHFAGGRMRLRIPEIRDAYSVSLWFWNGMPHHERDLTGVLFSRGHAHAFEAPGDHLSLGGTAGQAGQLLFETGDREGHKLAGQTVVGRWTWNHVVLVRERDSVRVYLNGQPESEIAGLAEPAIPPEVDQFFVGGRCDGRAGFEGRMDEVAIYDRGLTADEVVALYQAAVHGSPREPTTSP